MARTVTQNADLRFRGRDDGATKTTDKVNKSVRSLDRQVNEMPSSFSKSAAALNMFSGASSKMGGKVAEATGKLFDIGTLIAAGGPVGIALAAVTVAIGAAALLWDKYGEATAQTKREMDALSASMGEAHTKMVDLHRQLEDFGKTTGQAEIDRLQAEIKYKEESLELDEEALASIGDLREGWGELLPITEDINDFKNRERIIDKELLKQRRWELEDKKKLLGMLLELADATKLKKDQDEAATRATKNATQAERERRKAEKEFVTGLAKREAAAKRGADILMEQGRRVALEQDRLRREEMVAVMSLEDWKIAKRAEVAAQNKAYDQQQMESQAAMAASLVSAFGAAAAQMVTDSENAHKHMINLILDSVQIAINAYAIQAGAAAGAAVAWAPILIPAAAAAAIGVVKALVSQLPSFQFGGVVPGIDTGRDSVIATVRPNERIFSPEHNERMVRAMERGGHDVGATVIFQSVAPATSAEASKAARTFSKQLRRVRSRGF